MSFNWHLKSFDHYGAFTAVTPRGSNLDAYRGRAPQSWLDALSSHDLSGVMQMWREARRALPLFHAYLAGSLMDIAMLDGPKGPALAYGFRDWEDHGWDGLLPGVMVAREPASAARLRQVERSLGELPASLKVFWSMHATADLKCGRFLANANRGPEKSDVGPRMIGERYLAFVDPMRNDCLCLRREHEGEAWRDEVVQVFSGTPNDADAHTSPTVDRLLTDWEYRPYDCGEFET